MVSTFTPNIQLEEPARGDDFGTWDTPVNNNMTLLDLTIGANTMIGVGSGSVTLSAGQFRSAVLTFNSTLTANATITFPTSFTKPYTVGHLATGSSAFTITLQTTAGGQVIAIPPGEYVSVFNDGTNLKFASGLHRVGEYWDYAGSSVPNWVSGCTVPPYVQTVGGSLSSATYPVLFGMIGATLPDTRGRVRVALDAMVGRISSATTGFQANTLLSGGGDQNAMAHSHTAGGSVTIVDPGHAHLTTALSNICSPGGTNGTVAAGNGIPAISVAPNTGTATTGITASIASLTVNSALSGAAQNIQPSLAHGITLLRAA